MSRLRAANIFAPGREAPIVEEEPLAKRPRLGEAAAAGPWADETPPWACEGAAVTIRGAEGEEPDSCGVIVQRCGSSCVVRLPRSGEEHCVATSKLLPVAPKVGNTVRVVAGDSCGCTGALVGFAGAEGVVRIGTMSYQTLTMAQLAVIAS